MFSFTIFDNIKFHVLGNSSLIFNEISQSKIIINWCFIAVLVVYMLTFIALFFLPSIVANMMLPKILILILSPIGCIAVFLCRYELINEYIILAMMLAYIALYVFFLTKTISAQKKCHKKAEQLLEKRANSNQDLFW